MPCGIGGRGEPEAGALVFASDLFQEIALEASVVHVSGDHLALVGARP